MLHLNRRYEHLMVLPADYLHEYDHIEGKLFIDYLKPLKRKMLKGKLDDITKGKIKVDYRMVFAK
jgi:peptide deformylase